MGFYFLSEKIFPIEIVGMVICFVAFVALTLTGEDESSNSQEPGTGSHILGSILSFVGAWLNAGAFVTNRMLKGIDIKAVLFMHGVIGLLGGICYSISDGLQGADYFIYFKYSLKLYVMAFLSCLMDVACISTSLIASQNGSQSFVGLNLYMMIVYGFLTDIFIFDESIQVSEILAAGAILGTTLTVSIYKIMNEGK